MIQTCQLCSKRTDTSWFGNDQELVAYIFQSKDELYLEICRTQSCILGPGHVPLNGSSVHEVDAFERHDHISAAVDPL